MADFDFIQGTHTDFAASTGDLAYTSNVTNNSFLVAAVGCDANVTVSSVTSHAGTATTSAWSRVTTPFDDQVQHTELWWTKVTGAGSLTVRATCASAVSNGRLSITEFVDPGTITVQDFDASKTASTGTPSSGAVTFTAAGLLVGTMTPTSTAVAASGANGLTIRARSTLDDFNIADRKVAASGNETADWTISPSDIINIMAAAFQGSGGAGGGAAAAPTLMLMGVGT